MDRPVRSTRSGDREPGRGPSSRRTTSHRSRARSRVRGGRAGRTSRPHQAIRIALTGLEPVAAVELLELLGRDINEPVIVTRLTGGYRNLVHCVQGQGFDWVVKQYAPPDDNPLFPLRFEDESRLL